MDQLNSSADEFDSFLNAKDQIGSGRVNKSTRKLDYLKKLTSQELLNLTKSKWQRNQSQNAADNYYHEDSNKPNNNKDTQTF